MLSQENVLDRDNRFNSTYWKIRCMILLSLLIIITPVNIYYKFAHNEYIIHPLVHIFMCIISIE